MHIHIHMPSWSCAYAHAHSQLEAWPHSMATTHRVVLSATPRLAHPLPAAPLYHAHALVTPWAWQVIERHRPALGAGVAARLTSYLIHEPSLVLWARDRRRGGRALPPHVWVVEDDVVFLGDLRAFLHSYRPTTVVAPLPPASPLPGSSTPTGLLR